MSALNMKFTTKKSYSEQNLTFITDSDLSIRNVREFRFHSLRESLRERRQLGALP